MPKRSRTEAAPFVGKRRKETNLAGIQVLVQDPARQAWETEHYLFHALKLLQKAFKTARTQQAHKLTRKLNLTPEAERAPLTAQLEALKTLNLDPLPSALLHTRLPKLTYLHPLLPTLLAKLPALDDTASSTTTTKTEKYDPQSVEGKNHNQLLAHKLVQHAWEEIARAIGKRMGQDIIPVPTPTLSVEPPIGVAIEKVDEEASPGPREGKAEIEGEGKRLSKRAIRAAKAAAKALQLAQGPIKRVSNANAVPVTLKPTAPVRLPLAAQVAAHDMEEGEEEEEEEEYEDDEDEILREMARLDGGGGSDQSASDFFDSAAEESDDDDIESQVNNDDEEELSIPLSRPANKTTQGRVQKAKKPITSSAFLPSLAGGYISYSDSDGEDAQWVKEEEKGDKKERKNRRGQRARQAIWEQKYGSGANHIVKETGAPAAAVRGSKSNRNDTTSTNRSRTKDPTAAPGKGDRHAPFDPSTTRPGAEFNPNTQPVLERKESKVEKGMHPSWEAKRKATEAAAALAAAPKGKKITFT